MGKWDMVRLGDVCEILDSKRVPITASDRKTGVYPYYGANGIQDYVDDYIFDDELVLLAEDGGNFGSETRPIAYRVSGKCWVNNHAHVLKAKSMLDIDYLCYSIMFYDVSNIISGTTRAKLNQAAMRKMQIPLPSLEVQRKIAETLDAASELLAMRKNQLAELDKLIQSVFYDMFGTITEKVPFSYYIEALSAGKSLAGKEDCENKVLKTGATTYDYFDAMQVKNLPLDYKPIPEHLVKTGDVIISRMNTPELVGAAAYVWKAPERTYLPDRLWRAELKNNCNPIFVWQLLIQPITKDSIRCVASGTSGSMKNISKPALLGINIKKAPFDIQTQFAETIQKIEEQKALVQKAIDETHALFDSLMNGYFE